MHKYLHPHKMWNVMNHSCLNVNGALTKLPLKLGHALIIIYIHATEIKGSDCLSMPYYRFICESKRVPDNFVMYWLLTCRGDLHPKSIYEVVDYEIYCLIPHWNGGLLTPNIPHLIPRNKIQGNLDHCTIATFNKIHLKISFGQVSFSESTETRLFEYL